MGTPDDSKPGNKALRGLAFGVDEGALLVIKKALPNVTFAELPMDVKRLLKAELDFDPDLIFCGRAIGDTSIVDVAQAIRSLYASAPMFYASSDRIGFDRKELTRNGFTEALLMPMDEVMLRDLTTEATHDFRDVPLIDISPDTTLEFDTYLYLPVNRKFVRFSSAGRQLDASRVQRLINREVSSIHISRDQLPAFYKFSASQLKNLALNPAIGEAERRERMHQAVRSLLTCFLTDDTDMQDCAQIVKTYVTGSPDDGSSWYDKMMRLSGNHSGDAYSHVSNVSTLASMFAIGLGLTTVEEVALGGLLHEVGLADIPANIQMKKKRSNFEQAEYERHPMIGAEILRSRKITIPDLTLKIIEQHRERVDATGYPNRLNEVLVEAQLVAIADEYDEGTQVVPGQPRKSARAVMEEILKHPGFSAEVRARIADLLGFAKAPTDESAA